MTCRQCAGLLHAIGMVLIDRHLRAVGDPGMLLCESPITPLIRQEQRLIGMNHAQVAGLVLRKWNFGAGVVAPIEFQYEPARAPLPQAAMTTLLAEARERTLEVVRTLPPPGSFRIAGIGAGVEPGSLGARILALEAWLR